MTDEAAELEQVKIRHHGQCPMHKGHAAENYLGCIVVSLFVGFWLALAFVILSQPNREAEAIKRGYAIYSPTTAKFEWR